MLKKRNEGIKLGIAKRGQTGTLRQIPEQSGVVERKISSARKRQKKVEVLLLILGMRDGAAMNRENTIGWVLKQGGGQASVF